MTTYAQIIGKAKKYARENPPNVEGMSLESLHEAAEAISALLKGAGFGAADRLVLNEERKAYRAEIARRAA